MIDSQRKNARQRREIHLAREMRKAEATMKCPNCHGTDIDFTFSPPRCRFCNPVMTGFERLLKEALNAKVAELEATVATMKASDEEALRYIEARYKVWGTGMAMLHKLNAVRAENVTLEARVATLTTAAELAYIELKDGIDSDAGVPQRRAEAYCALFDVLGKGKRLKTQEDTQ